MNFRISYWKIRETIRSSEALDTTNLNVDSKNNRHSVAFQVFLYYSERRKEEDAGMTGQKVDKRVARTKTRLKEGLADLMTEKSIQEITVKELVAHVHINRSTFYLHYSDISNMLENVKQELIEEIAEVMGNFTSAGQPFSEQSVTVYEGHLLFSREKPQTVSISYGRKRGSGLCSGGRGSCRREVPDRTEAPVPE